ncbi:MAG: glycosyltransferase family 2 protein [Candidatus Freyarchaeota archaeon]
MVKVKHPLASVVILTYNRVNHVIECLKSIFNQNFRNYEVLVIDNLSQDGTGEILSEMFNDYENFRLITPSQRISIAEARNYGLRVARGNFVAFIDDDCLAKNDWLKNIISPFKSETIACVGGKISPLLLGKKPSWFRRDVYGIMGLTDWGEKPRDLFFPIGGNMALRRDVALRVGGFREALGPKNVKLFGEEISISERLRRAGFRVVYEPRAEVFHKLWCQRLDPKNLFERAYRISMGDYFLFGRNLSKIAVNVGILIGSALGYIFYRRINLLCHLFYALGYLIPSLTSKDPLETLNHLMSLWETFQRRN